MKKLQFKYDGSEDAKKCIEWVNEKNKERDYSFGGSKSCCYTNDGEYDSCAFPDYTLLTPSEFLREVTNQDWKPKYGERVIINNTEDNNPLKDNIVNYLGRAIIGRTIFGETDDGQLRYGIHIRPIPTLKQKIVEVLKGDEQLADRIIEMVKGGEND